MSNKDELTNICNIHKVCKNCELRVKSLKDHDGECWIKTCKNNLVERFPEKLQNKNNTNLPIQTIQEEIKKETKLDSKNIPLQTYLERNTNE